MTCEYQTYFKSQNAPSETVMEINTGNSRINYEGKLRYKENHHNISFLTAG
jgi:hypothetical protein